MNTGRRQIRRHRAAPRAAAAPRRAKGGPADECPASEAFDALWRALADIVGPTATAAILQRSLTQAAAAAPELRDVVIARDRFVYTYTLPASWSQAAPGAFAALQQLTRSLWPLLSELTGSVILRRLQQDPLLRRCGVIPEDAEP